MLNPFYVCSQFLQPLVNILISPVYLFNVLNYTLSLGAQRGDKQGNPSPDVRTAHGYSAQLLFSFEPNDDSAVGIALFPRDSLRLEGYPIFQAGVFAPWRPQATAGLRLFRANDLRGYVSAWGRVEITQLSGDRVSGTLDLHVKAVGTADSLQLTGGFTGVPVRPAARPCGRANKPATG